MGRAPPIVPDALNELLENVVESCALRRNDRVVSLGVGDGHAAIRIAERLRELGGGRVEGVDVAPRRELRFGIHAAQRGVEDLVRFHVGRAEDDDLSPGVFDVVLMNLALHRMAHGVPERDPNVFIRSACRLAKPDGRVVVCDLDPRPPTASGERFVQIMQSFGYPLANVGELTSVSEYSRSWSEARRWRVSTAETAKELQRWVHGESEQVALAPLLAEFAPPFEIYVWLAAAVKETR